MLRKKKKAAPHASLFVFLSPHHPDAAFVPIRLPFTHPPLSRNILKGNPKDLGEVAEGRRGIVRFPRKMLSWLLNRQAVRFRVAWRS
jgi:hypothetical protein